MRIRLHCWTWRTWEGWAGLPLFARYVRFKPQNNGWRRIRIYRLRLGPLSINIEKDEKAHGTRNPPLSLLP